VSIEINPQSPVPTFRQLADQLRAMITSGQLAAGDWLPSIYKLREETGLSQPTIRKAVDVLRDEGLVQTAPGRGVYVR
jgi:DNA-binding GntR family transcriptional regulator